MFCFLNSQQVMLSREFAFCLSIIYAYILAWMHLHRASLGRNSSHGYHYVIKKSLLRWLDTVFWGQYLPSLSINYVVINKYLEKWPPQLYQIKMTFVIIRVAMTSELSQQRNDAITYFTCSSISRHWELFFQNRSRELFPPIAALMFVKFKRNL